VRGEDDHVDNVLEEVPPHAEWEPVEMCLLRRLVINLSGGGLTGYDPLKSTGCDPLGGFVCLDRCPEQREPVEVCLLWRLIVHLSRSGFRVQGAYIVHLLRSRLGVQGAAWDVIRL